MFLNKNRVKYQGSVFLLFLIGMDRKSYRRCVVPKCGNTSLISASKLFIDVPRTAEIRQQWFKLAGKESEGRSMTSTSYFCEDHFDLPNQMENYMRYKIMGFVNKIKLKPGCLPLHFECQTGEKGSLTSRPVGKKRLKLVETTIEEDPLKITDETSTISSLDSSDVSADEVRIVSLPNILGKNLIQRELSPTTIQSHQHTSFTSASPYKEKRRKSLDDEKLDTEITHISTSSPSFQVKSESIYNNETAKLALDNMFKKIIEKPFKYVGLSKDCYFLVDLIQKNTSIPTEHILLCLKKIRLNASFSELAEHFRISASNAAQIFLNNIPLISKSLKPFIIKLGKQKRSDPIAFRHRTDKVICIIDCFEIEIEKPFSLLKQTLTWSEHKNCNTRKYLLSCTPNGLINYVSSGYGGKISDVLLVQTCEFLDQLKPGTCVLAEDGFKNIEHLLLEKNCQLLRSPTVVLGAKMTVDEENKTKQIISLKVLERVMGKVQEFSMLKPHSVVNSELLSVIDDCVRIACALVNLQDGIVD